MYVRARKIQHKTHRVEYFIYKQPTTEFELKNMLTFVCMYVGR